MFFNTPWSEPPLAEPPTEPPPPQVKGTTNPEIMTTCLSCTHPYDSNEPPKINQAKIEESIGWNQFDEMEALGSIELLDGMASIEVE